jgi:hypothetical protein
VMTLATDLIQFTHQQVCDNQAVLIKYLKKLISITFLMKLFQKVKYFVWTLVDG